MNSKEVNRMQYVSPEFKNALPTPHGIRIEATLMRNNASGIAQPVTDLPLIGGSVAVSGQDWVRRKATIQLAPTVATGAYTQARTQDLVNIRTDEVRLRWSLVFPDGTPERVDLGTYRIDSIPYDPTGTHEVTLTLVDRAADVADNDFLSTPVTLEQGSTTGLIKKLITDTSARFEIREEIHRAKDRPVPATQTSNKRSEVIQKLAEAIGARVYVAADGQFVIQDQPWLSDEPVTTIRAGAGGTLTQATTQTSRSGTYNAVVARASSSSGNFQPVQASAFDTNPASPTYYGDRLTGAYGKVPYFFDSPTITSHAQALAAAKSKLGQLAGILTPLDVQSIPHPYLEPGDTIMVIPENLPAGESARIMIVDSWTLDLQAGGTFTLQARDVRETTL